MHFKKICMRNILVLGKQIEIDIGMVPNLMKRTISMMRFIIFQCIHSTAADFTNDSRLSVTSSLLHPCTIIKQAGRTQGNCKLTLRDDSVDTESSGESANTPQL